jgi:hypothetical protein
MSDRATLLATHILDLLSNTAVEEQYDLLVNLLRDEIADIEMEVFSNLSSNLDQ